MDDDRYHLNPHRSKRRPLHDLPLSNRFARQYPDDDDDDVEDEGEEEVEEDKEESYMDQLVEEEEDDEEGVRGGGGGGYRRARDYYDDSSSESRGKRKRIDELPLGYEFTRRVPPPAASKPRSRAPAPAPDWSEESPYKLSDGWGDRFSQNGKRSLRSDEKVAWSSKINASDAEFGNRFDTHKKEKKTKKSSVAEHRNARSRWISSSGPLPGRQLQQQEPLGFTSSSFYHNRYNGNAEVRDSLWPSRTDEEEDNGDYHHNKPQQKRVKVSRSSDSSYKMLAESIQKFGDIYEKMESNNRKQMAELERARKEFQRDLELQKRQILERAQEQILKLGDDQQHGDEDDEVDDDDYDGDGDGDDADNLTGFISASFYLTAFV